MKVATQKAWRPMTTHSIAEISVETMRAPTATVDAPTSTFPPRTRRHHGLMAIRASGEADDT
jgi:hypothetical protein